MQNMYEALKNEAANNSEPRQSNEGGSQITDCVVKDELNNFHTAR